MLDVLKDGRLHTGMLMRIKKQKGITLPELIITMTLVALLATLATPSFIKFIQSQKLYSNRDTLQRSLLIAKSQAILNQSTIRISLSKNNKNTQTILIEDINGVKVYESTTQIIASPIIWSGFRKTTQFYSDGSARSNNGRFYQCNEGNVAWQLIINRQGRIREGAPVEHVELSKQC